MYCVVIRSGRSPAASCTSWSTVFEDERSPATEIVVSEIAFTAPFVVSVVSTVCSTRDGSVTWSWSAVHPASTSASAPVKATTPAMRLPCRFPVPPARVNITIVPLKNRLRGRS